MFQENSIETCIVSRVKQITSPGWMHETSARTWCTGKTQREQVEREVGGGIGMGNTCKPMAVSFQCMTKFTTKKKERKKKSSIFLVLSLLYSKTLTSARDYWKTTALTTWTFVSKVMSLLFNILIVIAFLTKNKCLSILWLQSLHAMISGPKKIKSVTISIFSPSVCHEVLRTDAMI